MKEYRWNDLKSRRLKMTRGASFEELLTGRLVDIQVNPSRPQQNVILIYYQRDIWVIPFVESGDHIFLKTLYRCRKYRKIYLKGGGYEKD